MTVVKPSKCPNYLFNSFIKGASIGFTMRRREKPAKTLKLDSGNFLCLLRELRVKLAQIDHKLDHLIKSYRRFFTTSDCSDSSHRAFAG